MNELARQQTEGRFTFSIVVADNDRSASARPVTSEFAAGSSIEIAYTVQPVQNIALTRNAALQQATGEFVALIDDDEFPEPTWLRTLLDACLTQGAAGILGPVRPWFETPPPSWIIKGRICERPEPATGTVLRWRDTRTGNVLFRRAIIDVLAEPFDPAFGNGGEDQDFFRRMIEKGGRFVWCNEAAVHEVVPPERWRRSYMLKRAFLRGQNEKRMLSVSSVAKSLLAVPLYGLLLPVLLIVGHHLFMRYFIRLADHAGKLLAALGVRTVGDKYLGA